MSPADRDRAKLEAIKQPRIPKTMDKGIVSK